MDPFEFLSITSSQRILSSHSTRYRTCATLYDTLLIADGMWNIHPPVPRPDASWGPVIIGGKGINSYKQVGRVAILWRIHQKLSRAVCTPRESLILPPVLLFNACCMWLKRLRVPGREMLIERK